jgi:hypothetical protein
MVSISFDKKGLCEVTYRLTITEMRVMTSIGE